MRTATKIGVRVVLLSTVMLFGSPSMLAGAGSAAVPGTWGEGAPMPTARTEVTSAVVDGVIYVIGGFRATGGNTDVVEAYDTAGDSWSVQTPLPQNLDHAGAAAVGDKVYVVGGYISLFQGTISAATYEYDPVADTWTARAPMPLARAAAATVLVDGIIYVLGGVGPQETIPLAYNPASNSWTQLAPIAAAREHLTASVVDGKIYVIGGRQNVTENVDTVEVYDPATDTWQTLAPIPTARGGLASGELAGRVHVVGGEDLSPGGATFSEHEVYDPASASWQSALPLPTARHGLTAQVVSNKLYVLGGGPTPGLSVSSAVEIFQLAPVGGLAELPEVTEAPLEAKGASGPSAGVLTAIAAAAAAGVIALGGTAWYARRQWLKASPE